MARFKRLPNNFGNINYLGSGRRRPYRARVSTGCKPNGQPSYYVVGYYEDYQAALMALSEYNRQPQAVAALTFAECFEKWAADKFPAISISNQRGYNMVYKKCACLHNLKMIDVTYTMQENILRDMGAAGASRAMLAKVKTLLSQIFAWAVVHSVVPADHDKTKYLPLTFATKKPTTKKPFTPAEIATLWAAASEDVTARIALMLIYSGMRINELLTLKKCDVHLNERYFDITHAKTAAGVRPVPIAEKVAPFVADFLALPGDYLITIKGRAVPYSSFVQLHLLPCFSALGLHHTAHECRHTCVSLLNSAGVNPTTIKKIVGHSGDMTENVYTHKNVEELRTAINSI